MKNKFLYVISLISLLTIAGCTPTNPNQDDCLHIDENADNICDICNNQIELNPEFRGYIFSKTDKEKPTSGVATVDIYSFNDFHGQIKEDDDHIGLAKFATFMKSKTANANTLFIDSGDTWQGSLESNYNYGKLINDVFCKAKCSVRTIGNHDFDWGIEKLLDRVNYSYNDYKIPILGANINGYDWNSKEEKNRRYDLGQDYAIFNLENGLRIGIIGTIGKEQITDISTQYVKDIVFTDHTKKIKSVSDYLRTKKGCDIIISSEHNGFDGYRDGLLTNKSTLTNLPYIDYGLNGHKHTADQCLKSGIYFTQSTSNGKDLFYTQLQYDFSKKKVSYSKVPFYYGSKALKDEIKKIDVYPEIQNIVNNYGVETDLIGNEVLTNKMHGYFSQWEQLPNLMAEAIYNECLSQNIEIDFATCNSARADIEKIYSDNVTYSDIYTCFPFDNTVYILDVIGLDDVTELIYPNNGLYNANNIKRVNSKSHYKLATLDYLAFHCSSDRKYDYFPNSKEIGYLKNTDGTPITYRNILAKYLKNSDDVFDSYNYSFNNDRFLKPTFSN